MEPSGSKTSLSTSTWIWSQSEFTIPSLKTVLLLDNRDSFVWNLAQALQILGARVEVVRSDATSPADIVARSPRALVISPGPGHPDSAGNSVAIVRELSGPIPILGVCLGHQVIAVAFGGSITRAHPCHGKPKPVQHEGSGLFEDLPNPLVACRYHSLVVERETLPEHLRVDAWNDEGLIMGLRHRSHPTYGVQFHPESFRSSQGPKLLRNFLEATES